MPKYIIKIKASAQKQLDKLPPKDAEDAINAIWKLAANPRPVGCKKLKGRDGYRIRKGNLRIIHDIYDHELSVDVIKIGNRKDIYNW